MPDSVTINEIQFMSADGLNNSGPADSPVCRELMTELTIRGTTGILLALYKDKSVIDIVSGRLKESLPGYFANTSL